MKKIYEIYLPYLKMGKTSFKILLQGGKYTLTDKKLIGVSELSPNYNIIMSLEDNIDEDITSVFVDDNSMNFITKIQNRRGSYIGELNTEFNASKLTYLNVDLYLDTTPISNQNITPVLFLIFNIT
tara:strand:+ start:20036 stop:20413 length:378 start_codon:yes stop_codon:yes gene_type:complete